MQPLLLVFLRKFWWASCYDSPMQVSARKLLKCMGKGAKVRGPHARVVLADRLYEELRQICKVLREEFLNGPVEGKKSVRLILHV